MSASTSGVKKTRAPRVPYTPPAARRSASSNKAGETQRTHDADRSLSNQPPREAGFAAEGTQSRGSPAVQPAKQERAGESTGAEENAGGERVERTSTDTCKPTPSTPDGDGVDRKGPAAKVVSAGSETSRRKPRQAWAQYVPPGRRGSARSNESARSSARESKPPKPTEESASGGSSDAVGGREAASQAAAPRTSTAVVADEPESAAEEEHTSTGVSIPISSSSSLSNACGDGSNTEPAVPSEERQAPVSSPPSPPPSPPPPPPPIPETANTAAAQEAAGNTPSPAVQQECQDGKGGEITSHPRTSATAASDASAVEPPCNETTNNTNTNTDTNTKTDIADADATTKTGDKEDQELPPLKPPAARYVPPGRRKALDAEAAAAAAGGGDGAAGEGTGPLWTSRAPVRVSQRERATDKEASAAARPAPARVARVVGGGMSAYGANISEYSEEMTREDVEACTAVVSNFPAALPPGQRDSMLQPFVALGGLVVWPRPDEALLTFATPALARQAVSARTNRSTVLVVELLSRTREERRVGYRRVELARPGRPPADVSSGSRLILGALGIRRPKPKTSDSTPTRKSAASKGGIRGRGAKHAQAPPTESTDSWDM